MKLLLKRLLWLSGVFHLEHWLRNRRTLTVAMFHRVLPQGSEAWQHAEQEYAVGLDEFEFCLRFFKCHYNVVSLEQVRRAAQGDGTLPDKALLISFDDGWQDNVDHAQPLLAKHGLRATLFVNVDAVRQQGLRWWQDALVEVAHARPDALATLSPAGDFYSAAQVMLEKPLDERCDVLAPWLGYQPQTRQMLDEAGLAALDRKVWDIGSHGLTHVPMTYAPNLDAELDGSARQLGQWCGGHVTALAFPHGRYTSDIVKRARETTYQLVFSSDARLNRSEAVTAASVLGRIHIPSAAMRDESQGLCARTLALFLWRRQIMATAQS
ncbi:MAG: polysaccharide deacetylase [Rhodocyclales bacterium]|nr:polysaccharide deacetylase [Rhodocyclales bacterium]